MALQYSPKIVTDSLVMCLDASNNKSYPTDLPVKGGLALWLDAADDSTFSYSSGTSVSQWRDKSGLNNHVSQATVANQPSRSTIKNSRKTLVFDGSNDTLFNAGNVFPSNTTDYTKIAVVYQTSTSTTGNIISSKTDTSGTNNAHAFYFGNSTFIQLWHNSTFVTSPNALAINTLGVISGTYINSSGLGSLYVNGTASGTGTTASRNIVRDIQIGAIIDSSFFTGEICEVLVFSRVLSATELKQVHTYLGQKWGISNTDRSIVDLAGNDDNGSFGGAAGSQNVANMPDYDFYNKGAFKFNGTSDFIQYPSLLNLGNVFTINFWIKPTSNTRQTIISNGYPYLANKGVFLTCPGNSATDMFLSLGNDQKSVQSNTGAITTGVVQMVTAVANGAGGLMKLYVNGSEVSYAVQQNADISLQYDSGIFVTGKRDTTTSDYLSSNLYALQIYNKALSATEISQNYEAQKSKFANTIVQQGLVLNLDVGNIYSYGGAGTTFYDVSPTALSWTGSNVTYNSDPVKYFSYNGSNSWLQSSTSAAFDTQTITMECWFYTSVVVQNGFLFEKGAVNSQYSMFLNQGDVFYFRTIGGTISNGDLTFTSSTYLTANVWNHVICTYNGSIKIIYVNGVQVASVNASGTLNTGQTNQYIGKYGDAGNNYPFNGRIGESRVYNIALSAAQVLQNYNATKGRFGL